MSDQRSVRIVDTTPRRPGLDNIVVPFPELPNMPVATLDATHGLVHTRVAILATFAALPDNQAAIAMVREKLQSVPVACIASNEVGRVELETGISAPSVLLILAAAAAVVEQSWGWDDSEAIEVAIGPKQFRFQVHFEGDHAFSATELSDS
jgi:hypothetical protein